MKNKLICLVLAILLLVPMGIVNSETTEEELPNLVFESIRTKYFQGGYDYIVTLKNNGDAPVPKGSTLNLSFDYQSFWYVVGFKVRGYSDIGSSSIWLMVHEIEVGENISLRQPSPPPLMLVKLTFVIDEDNLIEESNETDNTRSFWTYRIL